MKRVLWLVVIAMSLLVAFAPFPTVMARPTDRSFRIEASSYQYSPAEIKVNPGDTVHIELVSTDVVHGLYIDGYEAAVTADPGQSARMSFKADQPGSFRMRCNVTCGSLHPFMIGKLTVGPNITLLRGAGLLAIALVVAVASGFHGRSSQS